MNVADIDKTGYELRDNKVKDKHGLNGSLVVIYLCYGATFRRTWSAPGPPRPERVQTFFCGVHTEPCDETYLDF